MAKRIKSERSDFTRFDSTVNASLASDGLGAREIFEQLFRGRGKAETE